MKVGDIVRVMSAKMGTAIQLGIIVKYVKPPTANNWLEVFEVMTADGEVNTYTSASLRACP